MIGFFANQLNTVVGSACFALGVALLVASIVIISKKDNEENWQIPICRWECFRFSCWSHTPWEFETLLRNDKNIFFVASLQQKGLTNRWALFVGCGTNASKRCYATRSVVELGSHFPPEGRGACTPDAGRGNLRAKRENPSAVLHAVRWNTGIEGNSQRYIVYRFCS